jgi:transcriptional regulator with GAF, ATPase, and Fis domain
MNRPAPKFTPVTISQLTSYDWPGNVRELQNAVERAVILSRGGSLWFDLSDSSIGAPRPTPQVLAKSAPRTRDELKREERDNIATALEKAGGKVFGPGGAAELLGMKPTTLASRIKALGLSRKDSMKKGDLGAW